MNFKHLFAKILIFVFVFAFNLCNAQKWGLYTLYAPKSNTKAYLVDTSATPVTYKTWTFNSSKKNGYSTYLVTGDTLVRTYTYTENILNGGGITGGVQKVIWDGTVVWDFVYSTSTYCIHHDICPLPNGNVLMISYDVKSSTESTDAGASSATQGIYSEKIIEVKPTGATTGTIVWEWKLWDHLCQNYNSAKNNYVASILDNPQLMNINYSTGKDRFHMNGIDYNADLNQITVSMHMMNELYVIDHSTSTAEAATHTGGKSGKGGDFLYRWGNPAAYGASGTKDFNVIHDAHWVPKNCPRANSLVGYNNQGGTGGKSAIDIFMPPYDTTSTNPLIVGYQHTAGSAFAPSTYDYRYTSVFSASNEGNSQQLPNGNMIVNNAFGSIYEINSAGTVLWTKTGANSSHAYRFTLCEVRGPIASASASSTNITSGTPVDLYSSALSVTESAPNYNYSWSSDPVGFTSSLQNPTVTPNTNTTYTVTITNTDLGCSSSASVSISITTGIDEAYKSNNIKIYPNPSKGIVNIYGISDENKNIEISVVDAVGKVLKQEKNISTINISDFNNGIYYIIIKLDNQEIINKKLILIK